MLASLNRTFQEFALLVQAVVLQIFSASYTEIHGTLVGRVVVPFFSWIQEKKP